VGTGQVIAYVYIVRNKKESWDSGTGISDR
jgi:hypothetical protein